MAAPGYAYLTLGAARMELAARLEDPNYVYWTIPELNELIREAVHTWQALTATFKQRAEFTISPDGGVDGSAFYDLAKLPTGILGFSLTDRQLIDMVLAGLLEPPLTANWRGTGQFSFEQIASALQNRIHRWLTDTGANVTRHIQMVETGPSASRIFLPDGVLDVRRAAWRTARAPSGYVEPADCRAWKGMPMPGGVYTTLWRDDEYAMQAFHFPGSLAPADPPVVWGKFVMPPVGLQVYPPPLNPGQLETLVVETGPETGQTPAAVVASPAGLEIPEDFAWGILFGTLSDLLSADGPVRDPERAGYAESRYQESVELYRLNPVLLQTQINGVPVWSGSVFEMDAFLASWQAGWGVPQFAGMAGRNLVAFGPVPMGIYSVVMDLVTNIPLPVADGDFIQLDRGALAPLLDYAQHLACFKMAGAEFTATDKLRKNFYIAAALENQRITKGSFYRSALQLPAARQQAEVPRI